jgi:hypothetical protein
MKYPQKKSAIAVSAALALSACASTLLWTRVHQDDPRSFASTLAVDAAGATYVGGGELEAPSGDDESAWWNTPGAVFSKYDSNGQRLWTHTLADTGSIKSIRVLDAGHLLVHVGSPFMNPEASDAVWIASSETGELITQLDTFNEARPFADLDVEAGKIYVATAHDLAVYAGTGELEDKEDITETIMDIEVADSGEIFLSLVEAETDSTYQKRSTTLDMLWQTSANQYYAFYPPTLKALSGGGLAVLDNNGLTKYDAQGDIAFQNSLVEDLQVIIGEGEHFMRGPFFGRALLQTDASGDLYLATPVTDFYEISHNDSIPSNMVASTTIAKFSGETGETLWKDTLSTIPVTHPVTWEQPTQIMSNTNYWPIDLSVTESGIKMVVSAFQADYIAPSADGCIYFFDEGFPAFVCNLAKVSDTYSKVFTYDAVSGKRLKKGEKIKGNIRDVAYSATGQMHLVGDNANEADVAYYPGINLQWLIGTEFEDAPLQKFLPGGSAYSPQSQMFVSKYK